MKAYDEWNNKKITQNGIITEAKTPGNVGEKNYIPYHQVIRDNTKNTKICIVFDASDYYCVVTPFRCIDAEVSSLIKLILFCTKRILCKNNYSKHKT